MNNNLDLTAALISIFIIVVMLIPILYDANLRIEEIKVKDTKFSDWCNIVYITDFGIESQGIFEHQKGWCLTPNSEVSDRIYIRGWE